MASQLGARKNGKFKAVSTAPSINKTPVGSSTPPLPYPVTEDLSSSVGIVPNVRFNGDPAYVLDQSTQPSCIGDAAGSCKGVKSGTVSGEVKPVKGSSTVRISGKPVIREGDPCTLNGGNCPGIYLTEPAPSGSIARGRPSASTNPPVKPETPNEASWWGKASPWVHGALGLASFVPGLGIVTGAADAGIYAAEGDMVDAGLSAASMIPGGKIVTTAGKLVKGAAGLAREAHAAEEAAKLAREAEAAARAEKEAAEAERLRKADEEASQTKKPADDEAEKTTQGEDGLKVKQREHKVPCFHPFDKKKFMKMSAEEQKAYLKEMAKQLERQQEQINNMTAAEYKAARDAFARSGRNPLADGAQASYREKFAQDVQESIRESLLEGGMGPAQAGAEAATRTKDVMSKLAALHEPDMVAGGWMQPEPKGMGRSDVNSSIGSSWNQEERVSSMDAAADDAIKNGRGDEKMNVRLKPCRGKGLR
jgi:uncharacterized Zn-binding protein involved in type VI secretion